MGLSLGTPRRRMAEATIILVADWMMNMSDVVAFRPPFSANGPLAYSMARPDVRFATRNMVAPISFGGTSCRGSQSTNSKSWIGV